MRIPQQYLPVMPYLIVKNSIAFADFAKVVFGAKEQLIVPSADHQVMHGELRIGDAVIMFAEASEEWKVKPAAMFIYVEEVDIIYHKGLENGAKSIQEPGHKDYGYSAGFEDVFGNQWFLTEGGK